MYCFSIGVYCIPLARLNTQQSITSIKNMVEEGGTATVAAADARYTFHDEKLAELRKASPWKDDPRYFKGVAVSPSAVMKMVSLLFYTSCVIFYCCYIMFGLLWVYMRGCTFIATKNTYHSIVGISYLVCFGCI